MESDTKGTEQIKEEKKQTTSSHHEESTEKRKEEFPLEKDDLLMFDDGFMEPPAQFANAEPPQILDLDVPELENPNQ